MTVEEAKKKVMYHRWIEVKYLFYIPWPIRVTACDECGRKEWEWTKKGVFKISEVKKKKRMSVAEVFWHSRAVEQLNRKPMIYDIGMKSKPIKFNKYASIQQNEIQSNTK